MTNIKYHNLCSFGFMEGVKKLSRTQMNTSLAFKVRAAVKAINEAHDAVVAEFKTTVLPKMAALDERGQPIPEQNQFGFKLKEGISMGDAQAWQAEFDAKECTIKMQKLSQATIEQAFDKASAAELEALAPIFSESPLSLVEDNSI